MSSIDKSVVSYISLDGAVMGMYSTHRIHTYIHTSHSTDTHISVLKYLRFSVILSIFPHKVVGAL